MTITVDIPDELMERAMKAGHAKTPQELIIRALEEFARKRDQGDLIKYMGTLDDFMTPEELEASRRRD